jgi:hypothetical protein
MNYYIYNPIIYRKELNSQIKIKGLAILVLILSTITMPMVLAVKPHGPSADNGVNKGNGKVVHLYLHQRDQEWKPVKDGSWAKMTYLTHKNKIIFNGHKLKSTDYTLLNYVPPWPGEESQVIISGLVNTGKNLHGNSEIEFIIEGIVRLVLSDDYDGAEMTGWHRSEYLFPYTHLEIK